MGGPNRGMPKDFNKDSEWRLGEMQKRTRGFNKVKTTFNTQAEFIQKFQKEI
jgi:hypothetical protein